MEFSSHKARPAAGNRGGPTGTIHLAQHVSLVLALSLAMPAPLSAAGSTSPQETILFLGDSITAAGGYVGAIEQALTNPNPESPFRIIHRGIPSETVSGLSPTPLTMIAGVKPCHQRLFYTSTIPE